MLVYRIAGLRVAADMTLPGLEPVDDGLPADVTMCAGAVPAALEAPKAATAFWQADAGRFLLSLPQVGRFLVSGGTSIVADPAPGSALDDTLPFLIGTCIGAVLHQRGLPVLHGATVAWRGRAYVLCGRSGQGKSTLAAALCKAGCTLVADDISALVTDADGRPAVAPDGRRLKLFAPTIRKLALEAGQGGMIRADIPKYYVAPPSGPAPDAVPLGGVCRLSRVRGGPPLATARLSPLVAAQVLADETYRARIARACGADGRAMAAMVAVVRQVPVATLTLADDIRVLEATAAALMARWERGGD